MGNMSSKARGTNKSKTPTQLSIQTNSITRIDRYADRKTVERFLEAKFGPRIAREHGTDVLLWRIETRDGVMQITAPRQLTDEEIRGIQQSNKIASHGPGYDLVMTYGANDVQYQ